MSKKHRILENHELILHHFTEKKNLTPMSLQFTFLEVLIDSGCRSLR